MWLYLLLPMCEAARGEHTVNCSSQRYPTVPCSWGSDTTTLDLSNNQIEMITTLEFSKARGLKRLHLQFNQISSVDEDAFQHNPLLEYLDVSYNHLGEIIDAPLKPIPSLLYLDITGNVYDRVILGPGFRGLEKLQILRLGNPQVVSLKAKDMQLLRGLPLKELHLITGDLGEYDGALRGLKNLNILTLEINVRIHVQTFKVLTDDIINSTTTLKLKNLDLTQTPNVPLFHSVENSPIKSVTVENISITKEYCTAMFTSFLLSSIAEITIDKVVCMGTCISQVPPFEHSTLTSLSVWNLDNPSIYIFSPGGSVKKFFQPFLHLSLVNAVVFFMPCLLSQAMINLETLDFSSNTLDCLSMFPDCNKPLPNLRSMVVDKNLFKSMQMLSQVTNHMKHLVNLSANHNTFYREIGVCNWTQSLRRMSLRGNKFSSKVLHCLPSSLEMLDLSVNHITVLLHLEKMVNLSQLYLSDNRIFSLATLPRQLSLAVLYLDGNDLPGVNSSLLSALRGTELKLSNNPFDCGCDILTLKGFCQSAKVVDWDKDYRCEKPASLNGTELQFLTLPHCRTGLIVGSVILCLILVPAVFLIVKKLKNRCHAYNEIN
ncbi:toll-like receptor 2 [Amia ocellicauda]|uniref:toll-like receptor 2 n=1 Tax=Amia ocellicauda TaxID=2972642 RepID=UPI0034648424